MTATLRLPQIVCPVVGTVDLVNDGSLLAVGIVEPVGTAGGQNEDVLVFSLCVGLCVQHLLGFQQLAVQVGGATGQIVDGIELFGNELNISSGVQNGLIAVQVQDDLLALLQRDQTHSNSSLTIFHSGLKDIDCGFDGLHVCSHAAAENEDHINIAFHFAGNGQGDIGNGPGTVVPLCGLILGDSAALIGGSAYGKSHQAHHHDDRQDQGHNLLHLFHISFSLLLLHNVDDWNGFSTAALFMASLYIAPVTSPVTFQIFFE